MTSSFNFLFVATLLGTRSHRLPDGQFFCVFFFVCVCVFFFVFVFFPYRGVRFQRLLKWNTPSSHHSSLYSSGKTHSSQKRYLSHASIKQ